MVAVELLLGRFQGPRPVHIAVSHVASFSAPHRITTMWITVPLAVAASTVLAATVTPMVPLAVVALPRFLWNVVP